MPLLSNLLQLYQSNNASHTPEEDFFTECLSGVLKSDAVLRNRFIAFIIGEKVNEGFNIYTQKSYNTANHNGIGRSRCQIDLVAESKQHLIFVEIKVGSGEGHEQLYDYARLLEDEDEKKTYLRYCTVWKSSKNLDREINYRHIRWQDIGDLLKEYLNSDTENSLAEDFYQLLEENRMTKIQPFSTDEIEALGKTGDLVHRMVHFLNDVKPKAERMFKNSGGSNLALTSALDYHNLRYKWERVLSSSGEWSEFVVEAVLGQGKYFRKDEYNVPLLSIHLSMNKHHEKAEEFRQEMDAFIKQRNGFEPEFYDKSKGYTYRSIKGLGEFEGDDSITEMRKWVEDQIDCFDSYFDNYSVLDWEEYIAPNYQ
ncbi:MAG: PD-(D/E)XK nuclease family protein [Bacteroidota bacterium]